MQEFLEEDLPKSDVVAPAHEALMQGRQPLPEDERIPEIWSMRLSLLGAVLAVPGIAALLIPSFRAGSPTHILSFSVYGIGMLAMFLASAAFHHRAGRERRLLKNLDYCAIGLMISGSFTAFCVGVATTLAFWVLAFNWAVTLTAITLRITRPDLPKWTFISLYLAMGWTAMIMAHSMFLALGAWGAGLVVAGGLIYSLGTIIFNRNEDDVEPPGFGEHEIWHLFILGGAGLHYLAVYLFLLPS